VSGQPSDKNSTICQSSEHSDSRAQWLPVWMLELGEGNNRSAQTGCLLSRHTKRATMHAFLCIAQSRYHTSAVLHDAASCTPPGPPRWRQDTTAIDRGWNNRRNDVRLFASGAALASLPGAVGCQIPSNRVDRPGSKSRNLFSGSGVAHSKHGFQGLRLGASLSPAPA
jgi:hypothetical protein